ncbi:hypothetical protein [Aurantiacibacter sediminis]|uniref:hypothetical protein n=1 Tax=Aurantiacibacter sediminis TaxID=2793064 RepID=UPI0038993685
MLHTGRGSLKTFRLYIDRGEGLELLIDNDDTQQVRDTLYAYQAFATEFSLAPGEQARFVIQFSDTASSYMPLQVLTASDFYPARRANVSLVSAVVAGSLLLIFFNVLMFALTGKREFAWLGAAVPRQHLWHNSRRRSAECGPRLGLMFRRRACGVASADVRVSFALSFLFV